jgi:hypothetical protein
MEEDLLIPAGLAQAIADYLATKPFREVANFMAALSQLKPAEGPSKTTDGKPAGQE